MGHMEEHQDEPVRSPLVPAGSVQLSPDAFPVGPPRHVQATEPRVELVREGDIVRAIDVTCECGRQLRLRCIYPGQE